MADFSGNSPHSKVLTPIIRVFTTIIEGVVLTPLSPYFVALIAAHRASWWFVGIFCSYSVIRIRISYVKHAITYRKQYKVPEWRSRILKLNLMIDYLLLDPIVAFSLGCFVLHLSLTWTTLLVLSFSLSMMVSVASRSIRGAESYSSAVPLLFPEATTTQFVTRIPLGEIRNLLPQILANGLRERRPLWEHFPLNLLPHESVEPLVVYQRHFSGPPYDDVLKAFPNASATSFLLLRDDPRDGTRLFDRFKFYHEIAHVTADGVQSWGNRYTRFAQTLIAISLASVFSPLSFLIGAFMAPYVLLELITVVAYQLRLEAQADTLALYAIGVESDMRWIRKLCALAWNPVSSELWKGQRDAESRYRLKNMDLLISGATGGMRANIAGTGRRLALFPHQYPFSGILFFEGLTSTVSLPTAIITLCCLFVTAYLVATIFDKRTSDLYDTLTERIRAHEIDTEINEKMAQTKELARELTQLE